MSKFGTTVLSADAVKQVKVAVKGDKEKLDFEKLGQLFTPDKRLERLKALCKEVMREKSLAQLNAIPHIMAHLSELDEDLGNIGDGVTADELADIHKALDRLQKKVHSKKLTSASQFKAQFKELISQILEVEVNSDNLQAMKEGQQELKKLKMVSLNSEIKKHKQTAFLLDVPIVVSNRLNRLASAKLSPPWTFEPIMDSGFIIKGAKFVALDLTKVGKASAKQFIEALVNTINTYAKSPVVPFFDVSVEGVNSMAVLLIPQQQARYAASLLSNSEYSVYLRP